MMYEHFYEKFFLEKDQFLIFCFFQSIHKNCFKIFFKLYNYKEGVSGPSIEVILGPAFILADGSLGNNC